jgi:hypothetical protein
MFNYEVLGDGLVYYKNAIKDPYKIIEDIEALNDKVVKDMEQNVPGSHNSLAKPWHNWDYGDLHFCKQRWLPRSEEIPTDDLYFNEHSSISDRLFGALDSSFHHYTTEIYPFAARNLKGKSDKMSVLKYEDSGYLPEHTDHGSSSRTLSVVLYLNDNYDGGEINFPNLKNSVRVKPEAGSIIFFPSNFVFVHSVSEVSNGIRYALPNWYHNMVDKIHTNGTE